MRKIFAVLALLASGVAQAAGPIAHVSWVHPTEYTTRDQVTGITTSTPLPIADIKQTIVKWYAGGIIVGSVTVAAPATAVDVPGLICGDYNFVALTEVKSGSQSPDSTPPKVYATGIACSSPKAPIVTVN